MRWLLVTFGNGESGRLGLGMGRAAVTIPTLVVPLAKFDIAQIAAGGAHTAAVTSEESLIADWQWAMQKVVPYIISSLASNSDPAIHANNVHSA